MDAISNSALPVINQSPMNNNWFSGVGDFLSVGLDTWMKIEQIEAAKDAGGVGQKQLSNTVQTPAPQASQNQVSQQIGAQMQAKLADGLQIGVGTLGAVVAGVAVLYWLTRK